MAFMAVVRRSLSVGQAFIMFFGIFCSSLLPNDRRSRSSHPLRTASIQQRLVRAPYIRILNPSAPNMCISLPTLSIVKARTGKRTRRIAHFLLAEDRINTTAHAVMERKPNTRAVVTSAP